MYLAGIVRVFNAGDERIGHVAGKPVDRLHRFARDDVRGGKILQIGEHEAHAVSQVSVDAPDLVDDVGPKAHVVDGLDRGSPQP